MAWSEKVDEYVVEIERFGMMLENADKRRLLLDAVHRPSIWYLVSRFFRFLGYQIDISRLDCGHCGDLNSLRRLIILLFQC